MKLRRNEVSSAAKHLTGVIVMDSKQMETPSEVSVRQGDRSQVLHTLNWSSFGFALLQNLCAAFLALNSIRLAIGLGSVATAGGVFPTLFKFHSDAIRIPMMAVALVGAILNLLALWQIKRLRNRPSAQWRRTPLSSKQRRSEGLQFALSLLTLLLLAIEYFLHRALHS
jgi:hypothetical protein